MSGRSAVGRLRGETGSATTAVVVWMVVVAVAASAALLLTSVLATRSRAATAADLAALAGAGMLLDRPQGACPAAARIAADNGARLRSCSTQGVGIRVVVGAPVPAMVGLLVPGRGPELRARAHAELGAHSGSRAGGPAALEPRRRTTVSSVAVVEQHLGQS